MDTINTITDLRNYIPTTHDTCCLLGYYIKGDKEPLIYIYKAGTFSDNGGNIIVPTGANGAWIAELQDEVNIKHFGAKANDINFDNSICFQKLINLEVSIFVPSGIWYVRNTIFLTMNFSGNHIRGNGYDRWNKEFGSVIWVSVPNIKIFDFYEG
ncbi:hypothetical protein [Chryseobacterium luteum]|uniref:Uncharacterized protein n=1 Tax=Chryseobacterium luteum TaxID=421531 RepID=A0A085Z3M6_9FLAO|nr:hypothetical protein [Chryseobacterium luteum]KFE99039.1 hypothetical protein IX38_18555 [Chryseobacterium luteum]